MFSAVSYTQNASADATGAAVASAGRPTLFYFCVLLTNHRNVSENLNNFVKASGSVGEKKEDSGPADCREGSVFTAKLEI